MTQTEERARLGARLAVMQYGIAAIFALLALVYWRLQVVQYQRFYELAENNRLRTLTLRAPRGVLFDREGRVLVDNRGSRRISIVREHSRDLARTVRLLAAVVGLDEQAVAREIARHAQEPIYRPIPVVDDATDAQIAAVLARRLELPEVVVEAVPVRRYPTDAFAAHAFGYVGEANEVQVQSEGLPSGAIVGQSGLERTYNRLLMGVDGAKRVVVDSVGREIRALPEEGLAPIGGSRLKLTIDADLQRAAETGFRELGYHGAAVVLDPGTGEVLALVSLPAYDPNAFATGVDRGTWSALNRDGLQPLQNRAIQGLYSPGSTFKLVVAVAALEEDVIRPDFKVHCRGGAVFYGRYFKCHEVHGTVDLRHAIERSCNVYFYTVGNLVGVDRIHKWATALGLGVKSGIDLPHEVQGLVPSTAWKLQRTGEKWYAGETISVAIGQGQVSVTPISMAVMIATIANGGTRVMPHLVTAIDDGGGWRPYRAGDRQQADGNGSPPPPPVRLREETVAALHDGLWLVVNGAGTGARGRVPGRDVAGKTGTAQVISLQGKQEAAGRTTRDLRDHGWFVFFAPKGNPQIAGVVLAEHAEHGYLAAPIARHVIEVFFAKKEGRPLPPFNPAPFLWAAAAAAQ